MNDLIKRRTFDVASISVDDMDNAIAESRATTAMSSNTTPLLRLMKSGTWIFGRDDVDVDEGSEWLINTYSLVHGYCCWIEGAPGTKNTLAGEIMGSMFEKKPNKPDPIQGKPFSEQRGFHLAAVSGEHAGTEVYYKTASYGGMAACDDLLAAIQKQIRIDKENICPIVRLSSKHYPHPQWGRTYNPIFEIMDWVSADYTGEGEDVYDAGEEEPEEIVETKVTPIKRPAAKRPTGKPNTQAAGASTPAPEPAPVSAQPAHAAQRRRPNR